MNNIYAATDTNLDAAPIDGADSGTYDPKFFALHGRIGRIRYLAYSTMATLLMYLVLFIISFLAAATLGRMISYIMTWLLIVFTVAVIAVSLIFVRRRLNDLGLTGWLAVMILIPIVNIFFWLYLSFGRGDLEANRYGQVPAKNSTVLVLAGLILPLIFIVGVIAAIALPAYKDYTDRAKAAQMSRTQAPD